MSDIIWESNIGTDYHISADRLNNSTARLLLKRLSTDSIILDQEVSLSSGRVSTTDIVNWMDLAKSAIETN